MNKKVLLIPILALGLSCRQSAREFISVNAPLIALTHVRVIDGRGAPAREDQTIIIELGRIKAIGAGIEIPGNARVLDLTGRTALPGLVGMHDHLFYTTETGKKEVAANASFARLYLASGVTTIRTAGALDFQADLKTKTLVDRGEWPGPKIHLTSSYINHIAESTADLDRLSQWMNDWADEGATSFKVYTNTTRAELATVIAAAHKRGLTVAGHLCAVGFREAADLGIDSLEHGLAVDTEFYSDKKADECPERRNWLPELARMDVHSPSIQRMIHELVGHRVAVTSTLAIFETFLGARFQMDPRMKDVLTAAAYSNCISQMEHDKADPRWAKVWVMVLQREMEFEREFVNAGGLLMSGVDPTGWGGVVAGFGDQRGLELLVQAGFSPLEAIRIATANGAQFLGQSDIGTLETGKQADIVVVRGNPATNIADVRNVEVVFKDGIGYDSAKLIASVRGQVGS